MHTRRRAVLWSLTLGILTAFVFGAGPTPSTYYHLSRPTPATYYDL